MVQDAHSPLSFRKDVEMGVGKNDTVRSARKRAAQRCRVAIQSDDDKQTYFLQEYFGFTPSAAQAFLRGDPALKSFFWPLYVNTVIFSPLDWGAIAEPTKASVPAKTSA